MAMYHGRWIVFHTDTLAYIIDEGRYKKTSRVQAQCERLARKYREPVRALFLGVEIASARPQEEA